MDLEFNDTVPLIGTPAITRTIIFGSEAAHPAEVVMKGHFKKFDPALADAMGRAFDDAWDVLQRGGEVVSPVNLDKVREALALRIVDAAGQGKREPTELRNDALLHVRDAILRKS
jgi:hypothetical protein